MYHVDEATSFSPGRGRHTKENLDSSVLSNFGPISKLPFLSKILEKVVLTQLQTFLINNNVYNVLQFDFNC